MLLKSIKLKNFRQFKDAYLEFATGTNGRNVTIIKGENGSGKTTFEQAFFWCLYGETSFTDKILLNKKCVKELTPSKGAEVEVELQLWQGDVEYHIIRRQNYKIGYDGRISGDNPTFDIAMFKDGSPNPHFVESSQREYVIQSILNKQLAKYFFFDGEHIEKMSKEVTTGKKSDEFADAVKDLLGLNAIRNAIEHLNPSKKNGVIRSYNNPDDNNSSNERIIELSKTIDKNTDTINQNNDEIDSLNVEISSASKYRDEKIKEMTRYEDGKAFQQKLSSLQEEIDQCQSINSMQTKQICKDFNNGILKMLSASLIKDAMTVVEGKDIMSKDIPYIRLETLEYLLKRGTCICGTELKESSPAYNNIKDLENYVLPKSISSSVGDFKREALKRINDKDTLFKDVKDAMGIILEQDKKIDNFTDEQTALQAKFNEAEFETKLGQLNNEIKSCTETITTDQKRIKELSEQNGSLITERTRALNARQKLGLQDENNRRLEICRIYATQVFDDLKTSYCAAEKQVRNELEETMNKIFEQLYNHQLSLKIDERYHISVIVNSYAGDVETSEGQSIAVIFAFIAAIIKMARENQCREQDDTSLLYTEPYPLVMDAPLSAFDKRRIKNVCETLPEIAEQVVIFIKDTDGDIAENNMGARIGMKYNLYQDEDIPFETTVKQDGEYNVR